MLSLRNISLKIKQKTILHDVSLDMPQGELIGLIGPNGAGKSTLMRMMANVLKPDTGAVYMDDVPVRNIPPQVFAKQCAYLAQGAVPESAMQAELIVALGRLPHNVGHQNSECKAAIMRAMMATAVADLAKNAFNTLSGGKKMRVLLARALAVEAPILLADEPVAALDPYHQLMVMELFQSMTNQSAGQGKTVVIVLHDLTLASRFCDRLILLDQGQMVANGAPSYVLSYANLAQTYGISAIRGTDYIVPWERV